VRTPDGPGYTFLFDTQITSKLSFTQSGSKSESIRTNRFDRSRSRYPSISQSLIRTIKSFRLIFAYLHCTVSYIFFALPLFSATNFLFCQNSAAVSTFLESVFASRRRSLLHLLFFLLFACPFYQPLRFPSTMRSQDIPTFSLCLHFRRAIRKSADKSLSSEPCEHHLSSAIIHSLAKSSFFLVSSTSSDLL
jgi:hypothetical protein